MRRYSRYSRYRTKSHDKATISHDISRYSRYQTALPKLQEIKTTPYGVFQHPSFFGGCCFYLVELGSAKHSFAVRPKNSPPDCFLNGLTILQEITRTAPTSAIKWHPSFWWVPFLLSRLVPRPPEHSSGVRAKNSPPDCFPHARTILQE